MNRSSRLPMAKPIPRNKSRISSADRPRSLFFSLVEAIRHVGQETMSPTIRGPSAPRGLDLRAFAVILRHIHSLTDAMATPPLGAAEALQGFACQAASAPIW